MQYSDALAAIIDDVVAPNAADVDRNATFPRQSLDALGRAGILGLLTGADAGGAGLGLRQAAEVVNPRDRPEQRRATQHGEQHRGRQPGGDQREPGAEDRGGDGDAAAARRRRGMQRPLVRAIEHGGVTQ